MQINVRTKLIFSRTLIQLLLASWVLISCNGVQTPASISTQEATPTKSLIISITSESCNIGTGMRKETVPILLKYKDSPALVMTSSVALAATNFPKLEGWIRSIGSSSLQDLQQKAEQAYQENIPYEAISYGLESGQGTPEEEWSDLVGSTQKASNIASQFGKLLIMAPGFRLMSKNEDEYTQMAALTDIWVIQTQQLQLSPPGDVYKQGVQRVVELVRSGNPDIKIWAQITLPPNQEPDPNSWLAYRASIMNLVNGTYLGVYTWGKTDTDTLINAMDAIYDTCENK
jgi:hypothetical protein